MMRSHGTDVPREFYLYGKEGEPVYDALVDAVKLRYSLLPYIYSTSWDVSHNRSTFMRALVMDFASDKRTWNIADEYMFGDAFLLAPVVHAQYTPELIQKELKENDGWGSSSKTEIISAMSATDFTTEKQIKVYLPEGTKWYDFWNNKCFEGGNDIEVTTSLNTIPLFVRSGSIVPMGPEVQYTSEKPWTELEIRVYPGSDGSFTLYEDEFDNYNYENGAYTEIAFTWNDKNRTLSISSRNGEFPGMIKERKFTLRTADGNVRTVVYSGKKTKVKL